MNIMHRISYNDRKSKKIFQQMNIKSKGEIVCYFDIGENDENWKQVQEIVRHSKGEIIDNQFKTIFSKKELSASQCFVMIPTWHFLYPEPKDGSEYEKITYDSSKKCDSCNQGLVRRACFSIREEPKWGNKDIGQLNWVFDEFFITERLKNLLYEKFNLSFSQVSLYKTNDFCKNTFNLKIDSSVEIEDKQAFDFEICPVCGRIKYHMCHNNFFPKINMMNNHIVRTKEFFGSGKSAYNQIIIDRALFDFFTQNKIKGCDFIPVFTD